MVAAAVVATSGCASREQFMARPGEGGLTAASVQAPASALVIAAELWGPCKLHATKDTGGAENLSFDPSLIAIEEIGPLEQIASCFTTGPMKGRTLTLRGRADPRGWRQYTQSLGQRRTDALQDALVAFGLPSASVTTALRGGTDAMGKNEPGWQTDRWVDVEVDPIP